MSRLTLRHHERAARPHGSGRVPWVPIVATIVVLAVVAVAVGALQSRQPARVAAREAAAVQPAVAFETTQPVAHPGTVEVPDVVGMRPEDAKVVLAAAGVAVTIHSPEPVAATTNGLIVESQDPAAGVLVASDSVVTLALSAPRIRMASPKAVTPERATRTWVVCIDPGHQERGDSTPEPVGPGSKATKPRVTGGTTGVKTRIPEYEIALQIAMNLKARLERRGVKVVMTRTTNDVNLSNSERAGIANRSNADLFVRIHGDGSPDESVSGLSTLFPASNTWTRSFAADSRRAARLVQLSAARRTGAVSRGTKARTDLSGFNWAEMPCVLVECGFLSNPVEDRLLASPHYQDKVATGIADGVVAFLKEQDQ